MNFSSECPFDIEKVLSQCGFSDFSDFRPLKWRRVFSPKKPQPPFRSSHAEVIVWGTDGSKYFLLCAVQEWSGSWDIKSVKVPAFENDEQEDEAARVLGELKDDDYWDDVDFMREYDHQPTEEELLHFLRWAWHRLPEGYGVEWEGSACL
jgi:hypothetical protein